MSLHAIKDFIEHKAYTMRVASVIMTTLAGSGHPTSALSAADIMATLFFYAMRFDPQNPKNKNNDRFILSKGHASPILYAVWKELGVLTDNDLTTYRKIDSVLEGHPTARFSRAEAATGSLGNGLGIGAGMALAARLDNLDFYTYVLLGDSECAEGSVWEAAELSAYYKLENLVAIMDCNRLGQTTETIHGHHLNRYEEKFKAFGWEVIQVDGHSVQELMSAFDKAREYKNRPVIILAKTIKGYGVAEVQDKNGFHGKPFKKEETTQIIDELAHRFPRAASYTDVFKWQPTLPAEKKLESVNSSAISLKNATYKMGEKVATRFAFGTALAALGSASKAVVSLDAEVKNSTYAELFEAKYPERFFQCLVAEQNMVNMAVGLASRGKVPFVSTFGAFFSRAFDQIRMAAIGTVALNLVGSHAGVSIGEDGPSQMALEDIALMRTLPESIVLYPSDAVSTHKLVEQMAQYTNGIAYLRTTRGATPVIYDNNESFEVGGCKIVRQSSADKVCVVAAGITLFEALKAYDQLLAKGIAITVVDLYSIKPIDHATLIKCALATRNIITVEDHYLQGGIGEAVAFELHGLGIEIDCLAVKNLPRSGQPEELLALAEIDAAAIVRTVEKVVA
jgi:transketolase